MTRRFLLRLGVLLLLLALSGLANTSHAFLGLFGGPEAVRAVNGEVRLPLSRFKDGAARQYSLESGGKTIGFFALKGADNKVRTAFNACDVCYPAKKGYQQDGEFMVCVNCGQRFHASRVGEARGGCNPSPLQSRVEGQDLVIKASDIAAGANFF